MVAKFNQVMASFKASALHQILAVALIASRCSQTQTAGTCQACNCKFNNVQVLEKLIDQKIRSTRWIPVNKTSIITLSSSAMVAGTYQYSIPGVIPDSASELLLYISVTCGHSSTGDGLKDILFYTMEGDQRFGVYLQIHAYHQDAINTNSDNVWLPMPTNRLVYVEVPVTYTRGCVYHLSTTGYRP